MTTLTTERLQELAELCSTERLWTVYGSEIKCALTRLIEVEAENVRLHTEIDASAFSLTPAMVQARNVQLCAENKRLRAELAAIKAEAGPEPVRPYGEWSQLREDDYQVALFAHYKRRVEYLAARNVELESKLSAIAAEQEKV